MNARPDIPAPEDAIGGQRVVMDIVRIHEPRALEGEAVRIRLSAGAGEHPFEIILTPEQGQLVARLLQHISSSTLAELAAQGTLN